MAPTQKVKAAFKAMRDIGIPENKTKPALKKLLKLFDKKWDLIEEENYRLLADTIFEFEETEAAEKEQPNNPGNFDQGEALEEASKTLDEPDRPLKRLRLKHQNQDAPSSAPPLVLKTPKPEPGEPEAFPTAQPSTGSPQPLMRNKGKQPVPPELNHRNRRPGPERSSQGLQIKEQNAGVTPKPKQSNAPLIKPKDEPFTDDMISIEPLAVVHPDQMHQDVPANSGNPAGSGEESIRQEVPSNTGHSVSSQDDQGSGASKSVDGIGSGASESVGGIGSGASKSVDGIDRGLGTLVLPSAGNHLQKADVSKRTPAIDIAASSLEEVKLSLTCKPGLEGFPDLEVVLKTFDDICLRKYKITDKEFSVTKVMKELCDHVVDLGTNQLDGGVLERNGNRCLQSNRSISAGILDTVAATSDLAKISDASNLSVASKSAPVYEQFENATPAADSSAVNLSVNSLVLVQPQQANSTVHCLYDPNDISRGVEGVVISLDKTNCDSLPFFHYIPHNVISHNANLIFSIAQIGDEDSCPSCCGDCLVSSPCNCAQQNGESIYTLDGLVREEFLDMCIAMVRNPQKDSLVYCKECPLERLKNEDMPDPCKGHLKRKFIKECWIKCGCSRNCGNKVIQRGISHNLQVFWTPEGKGWGLRALKDIPKGSFICEYAGEILTCTELHKRNSKRSNDKHAYAVLLDSDWGTRTLKETEILCLDSTYHGNVARFINHRCSDANLIEIPVEVEIPNHHYYHVALFTTRNINAFEELTWDYGLDFDDGESLYKAFRCLCNSKFCRNIKRSNRSRSAITLQ